MVRDCKTVVCRADQLCNPKSGRCVKKSGRIGKELVRKSPIRKRISRKKSSPRKISPKVLFPKLKSPKRCKSDELCSGDCVKVIKVQSIERKSASPIIIVKSPPKQIYKFVKGARTPSLRKHREKLIQITPQRPRTPRRKHSSPIYLGPHMKRKSPKRSLPHIKLGGKSPFRSLRKISGKRIKISIPRTKSPRVKIRELLGPAAKNSEVNRYIELARRLPMSQIENMIKKRRKAGSMFLKRK